jgi:hypothetical protein
MARSYNSVGAGVTPKLGGSDCCDVARPGGSGQHAKNVKVTTNLPTAGRPGGAQGGARGARPSGDVARPGGAQSAHVSGSPKRSTSPD